MLKQKQKIIPYLFILPFFVMFVVFQLTPVFYGFWMSLNEITILAVPMQFMGIANYRNLFSNPTFYHTLRVTGLFTIAEGAFTIFLGLGLALLLDIKFKGRTFYRLCLFLPVVTSLVLAALIWRLLLDQHYGLINAVLRAIGLRGDYGWLTTPDLALPSVIVVSTWRWFGFLMIILLAGLQNIPRQLYDAAKVDGASPLRIIWHVTLPLLFPIIFFCLIIITIGNLMVFAEPYILTPSPPGGPGKSTLTVALYLYFSAFRYFKLGYAAALGYIITLIIIATTLIQTKVLGKKAGWKEG